MKSIFISIFLLLNLNLFANTNYMYKDLSYLNLTKIQEEQIKEILLSQRKEFSEYYVKKQKAQKKLQELIISDKFDEEEYEDILEDIYEEAVELETKIFKKLHSILTPNQRKLFSKRLQEWRVE